MQVTALDNGDPRLAIIQQVTSDAAAMIAVDTNSHPVSALLALAKQSLNMLGTLDAEATTSIVQNVLNFNGMKISDDQLQEFIANESAGISKLITAYEKKNAGGRA